MSTVKDASPLKEHKMRTFERVQATLNFKYKIAHSMNFPLNLSLKETQTFKTYYTESYRYSILLLHKTTQKYQKLTGY